MDPTNGNDYAAIPAVSFDVLLPCSRTRLSVVPNFMFLPPPSRCGRNTCPDGYRDIDSERQTYRETKRHSERQRHRETYIQIDRDTVRQRDKETKRQGNIWTKRQ